MNRRARIGGLPSVLLIFCAGLLAAPFAVEIANIDFYKAYYPAGSELLRTGTFHYSYEGFKNLPLVTYLFVPISALEREAAAKIFLAAELATYLGAFLLSLRFRPGSLRDRWMLLFLFLSSRAFYTCLRFGQLTLLAFLLLVGMVIAYERGRRYLTGALNALAFVLKIPLGFFFVYFLVRRQRRIVAAAAFTYLLVLATSLLYFGVELHRDYVQFAFLENLGATVTGYNNISISASVLRFLRPDPLFDWQMVQVPLALELAGAAVVLSLLFGFHRLTAADNASDALARRLEISMVICLSLIAFPIVWDHYTLFLILPFYFASDARWLRRRSLFVWWLTALVLVNVPVLTILSEVAVPISLRAFHAAVPAAPLLGCLTLLGLLMLQYREHRLATAGAEAGASP